MKMTTARLVLRSMVEGDVAAILAMEADPHVMRYTTGLINPSPERRAELLDHMREPPSRLGHRVITLGEAFTGWVSLTPLEDTGRIQLAYRLVHDAWGHGYATEAAGAMLNYGFTRLELPEIVAVVWPDNVASVRVLEKLGFCFEKAAWYYGAAVSLFVARP